MNKYNEWIDVTLECYDFEDGSPTGSEYFYYFENGDFISYVVYVIYNDETMKIEEVRIKTAYIYFKKNDDYLEYSIDGEELLLLLNLLDKNTEDILRDWFLYTYNTVIKLNL